ncbi:RdgB/HAM1 family non-canonical purine NTP pyrophosphatase [Membranihabitans maritimus]|uniref:RdgB/HAM1 family non-canonical purine NTP pyrophosphatase n=1 Tax=Membranihabitans maritimus TaxID=2904244 RepID=UPI001F00E520|nr:RdgB/HAM1 family non-canonical purine NTP pyrophosphatase [Membranihabitans maritimus]
MKDKLLFATSNQNKLMEVQKKIGDQFIIKDLKSIGFNGEIPETQDTIEGNAVQKATFIYEKYQINCFAEDTGLEIEALNGEPGVYSARYAGDQKSNEDNIELVLHKLKDIKNRNARFKTVLAYIENGDISTFEGIIYGTITTGKSGDKGFGYDPIFLPDGYDQTFAELSIETKNTISHRALALQKFIQYLHKKS